MKVDFLYDDLPTHDGMGRTIRRSDLWGRLQSQLQLNGECIEFNGARNAKGYGRMHIGAGRVELTHRLAWMAHHGSAVPRGKSVLHSCDNPPCCNPEHLRIGTPAENSADMVRRGRQPWNRGDRSGRTKYPDALVSEAIRQHRAGLSHAAINEATGIPVEYLSKIFAGKRRAHLLHDHPEISYERGWLGRAS